MAQICTTKEQSERLQKLGIKRNTADMFYPTDSSFPEVCDNGDCMQVDYPAWSLGALIKLLPEYIDTYELSRIEIRHEEIVYLNGSSLLHATYGEDIFENCIRMIEALVKNEFIKTDK